MTAPARLPSIKSPEIKRRCKAVFDAAEANGLNVAGMRVEFNEQGMVIEVLDKDAVQSNAGGLSEWV